MSTLNRKCSKKQSWVFMDHHYIESEVTFTYVQGTDTL